MAILLYLLLYLVPYAEKTGFFSENETPDKSQQSLYLIRSAPIVLGYVICALIYWKRVVFPKCIIYPLGIANVYTGTVLCLLYAGGTILWFILPSVVLPLLILPVSFIYGLVKDIQYVRR
ncbi:MAG: hypothetical protein K0R57_2414 [Paenibacillaceae bacterium]|nr:hypothetical protein [Paenibacillaceae bacterium]